MLIQTQRWGKKAIIFGDFTGNIIDYKVRFREMEKIMFEGIELNRNSEKTASSQIAELIREMIHSKRLCRGDRLPTTQQFMKMAKVGPNTVRKAMAELESEGLVESTPRRGTFVSQPDRNIKTSSQKSPDNDNNASVNVPVIGIIAPMGFVGGPGGSFKTFRADSMEGAISECNERGVLCQVIPNSWSDIEPEKLYRFLVSKRVDGLIWQNPSSRHWETINYFENYGLNVVVTRRHTDDDVKPCIEFDFDLAGLRVGEHLRNKGADNVLLLSHYDVSSGQEESEYPLGLEEGIMKAFEQAGFDRRKCVSVERHSDISVDVSRKIRQRLEQAGEKTGVLFTNGYQFLAFLQDEGKRAVSILRDLNFAVISNRTINTQINSRIEDIDFMILCEDFSQMTRLAVQKLLSRFQGMMDDTRTVLEVRFQPFSQAVRRESQILI